MLSMGITLSPKDFVNVLKRPNAVLVGFVFCYVMMPALAYALGVGANLSPSLLAGLVLVGCINGGQASNLCTFIANGNVSGSRAPMKRPGRRNGTFRDAREEDVVVGGSKTFGFARCRWSLIAVCFLSELVGFAGDNAAEGVSAFVRKSRGREGRRTPLVSCDPGRFWKTPAISSPLSEACQHLPRVPYVPEALPRCSSA